MSKEELNERMCSLKNEKKELESKIDCMRRGGRSMEQ